MRATLCGVAAGLLAAIGGASAAQPTAPAPVHAQIAANPGVDPALRPPSAVSISNIDFKRGDGGAGRLIVHFSGEGAMPDLKTQGGSVVVNVGNANVPANLQRPLDVSDFATPVERVDAIQDIGGARLVLTTNGPFEPLAYQTGNDYIVEIVPRAAKATATRTGEVAVGATTAGGASAAGGAPKYSGKPVTFNFQDVPVRTVLQLIAEESNLNIVASDTVTGNVTLRLINVPWDQALDLVLQAKGLDKRRNGNVVWVAPQAEIAKYEQDREDARIAIESRAELVSEYIPISYGNAEDIAKLLTDESKGGQGGGGAAGGGVQTRGFLSPRGSVSFDRRTNTLLVIDIAKRVDAVKDIVHLLDKPVDQVVIESRIVIANESFARELGAKFGIRGTQQNTTFGGSLPPTTPPVVNGGTTTPTSISGLNVNLPSTLPGAGSVALSILNGGYALDLELSALQTEGRGEVISNPRVVTSNQKEALIKQGQEVGYLTLTGAGTAGGTQVPQVQFKEAVLQMKVTPTITADGRVFLNMDVIKDEVAGYVDTGVGQVPTIAKREVNTAVLMEDGQTVVIGGVYEFKDQRDLSKVPFLGDLPVIGNLFKKHGTTKSKAELLIFVTPKVIRVAQR
jgi:type IV pilus assembly protein PilQ